MRTWKKSGTKPQRLGILLFDRFSNHCLANAMEPLRAANTLLGREVYQWDFLSLNGATATSSSGLPVSVNSALAEAEPGEFLFVLPSYEFRDFVTPATIRSLRRAARKFKIIAGLDAGSWLLAAAGLLDGRRATIHWDETDAFREAFPDVDVRRSRLEIDGDLWTCGGAMTAFDLALRMIADTHGEALRLEVAALLMSGEIETQGGGLQVRPRSQLVFTAVAVMRENLEEPLSIPQIARQVGLSARKLEALFAADLGAGPQKAYRRIRLLAARRFVEQTGLSVAEIAVRSGYADPSALTRALREEFNTTPRKMRSGV
ncbi:MAG: GlxA family transcriptional regulator [Paracoccaceae bacterium]